jgi:three-Cys-motif partner protein
MEGTPIADTLPTVWPAEPHTRAKHRILKAYLDAWMPILSRQAARLTNRTPSIRYIDGFAGPGIYEGGEKGSPVLALESALFHSAEFPVPIDFTFIEADKARCESLSRELSRYWSQVRESRKVVVRQPVCGECEAVMLQMMDDTERRKERFGPALAFLDQFGYSAVPMSLIARVLSHAQCEVLTYLFWRELDRFISDSTKHAGISRAFGSDDWKPAIQLSGQARSRFMLDLYVRSLAEHAGAAFVWPFTMRDRDGKLLYWLFFCTNSKHGLREMKRAMWKVDDTGSFNFSDAVGEGQMTLLKSFDQLWLAGEMKARLTNRTMTVDEIDLFTLTETPCFQFKEALKGLEQAGIARPVDAPSKRRAFSYEDGSLRIRFVAEEPQLF